MAIIIDGKKVSQKIKDELKIQVQELKAANKAGALAVIQVGSDPASCVYVRNKKNACAYIGIESIAYELPEQTSQDTLLSLIHELNEKPKVCGILVQLPLPIHIDEEKVIEAIAPQKDVDCFHPRNVGALVIGRRCDQKEFLPCTPAGIIQLLKRTNMAIAGKNCVIIGRSNIVGKPMSILMLRENATVTVAHSKTQNLAELCRQADILIVAIGKPRFVNQDFVKQGAVVIDVGIHRDENGKLCGDVDFLSVEPLALAITPVPGGVGPMTIAMLMSNCVASIAENVIVP